MGGISKLLKLASRGFAYAITIGNSGNVYGYNSTGPVGSIAPTSTYVDRGGTSRTITAAQATDNGDGTYTLALRLNGAPANVDTVFLRMIVAGVSYSRSSSVSTDLGGGVRQWAWAGLVANPIGTSGTVTVALR